MINQKGNLKIGLLDNSSHSLKRGYEMWGQWKKSEDAWLLKESVIWVHHGIELALKQLLVQTNEFLVFQDVDRAVERLEILRRKKGMENAGVLDLFEHDGRAISVGFGKLIDRVAITLSIDELANKAPLREKIDKLTKYRNSIVHFSIELNVLEVSGLLSEIINPLLLLLSREVQNGNFKNHDIPEIRQLGQALTKYMEDVRSEIINNAITSTIGALPPEGNGKAGIVWQALGSGLNLSLVSYVKKVMELKKVRNKTIIILSDRRELVHQVYQFFTQNSDIKPLIPGSKNELVNYLTSEKPEIIITTIQKIEYSQYENSERYLFIGFNINVTPMTESLLITFPNSTYILFSSSPPELECLLFGDVVGQYHLQQAIRDEVAIAFKIARPWGLIADGSLQQSDLTAPEVDDDLGLVGYEFDRHIKSDLYLKNIAALITAHFESRQEKWKGKGIVVASDISTVNRLADFISDIEPEWFDKSDLTGYVKPISSVDNVGRRNTVLQRFQNPDDSLSLLIGTGAFLVGYDNPLIHTIYVTSPISRQFQYKLASLVSRRYDGKEDGVIFDFVDLDWQLE